MPSFQTMMMSFALLALGFLQLCAASPVARATSTTPTLPLTGAATELPATTLKLVHVAIGRGIQNYTCANTTTTPVAIGAIANLFDATALASTNIAAVHAIPGAAVNTPADRTGCFVLPAANKNLPLLGKHYFDISGTPTFDLTSAKQILFAGKNAAVNAPANAPVGPAGTGAVQWLQLNAKPAPYTSVGLGQVYRVETAGGMQTATCTKAGILSVQYAAEYWFYV